MSYNQKIRILVVDDDPEIRQVLERFLRLDERVEEVQSARDGKDAIEALGPGARFDIVVADERMPRARGVDVLAHARENHPHIVRVLISGYRDQGAAVEGINRARIDQYLEKPIELSDFVNRLFDLIETREVDATVNGEVVLNAREMARMIHQRKKGEPRP